VSIPETTLVRVTAEHIAAGIASNCFRCPAALAVLQALGDPGDRVEVRHHCVFLYLAGGRRYRADSPVELSRFIDAFDDGERVEPFEFELNWAAS
jgi:hypothetical protein